MENNITIRTIKPEDWKDIQEAWIDFWNSEYRYYDQYKETSDESVKKHIQKWAEQSSCTYMIQYYAICLDNETIGFISSYLQPVDDLIFEIGYGMKSKYQGHGYAKQAIKLLIAKLKEMKVDKIIAGTAIENTPSVNLLRSLGFELVSTETLSFHKDENGNDITFLGGNFELVL